MSEKSRYVTKASLRHITANDEASSLSGDFIIAHHSPAKVLTFKKKKFYICSDGTHTHTSHIARFDFWKSVAGRIGTTPVKVNLSKANVHTGNHFIQKRNSEPVEGLRSHRGSSCVQP